MALLVPDNKLFDLILDAHNFFKPKQDSGLTQFFPQTIDLEHHEPGIPKFKPKESISKASILNSWAKFSQEGGQD